MSIIYIHYSECFLDIIIFLCNIIFSYHLYNDIAVDKCTFQWHSKEIFSCFAFLAKIIIKENIIQL